MYSWGADQECGAVVGDPDRHCTARVRAPDACPGGHEPPRRRERNRDLGIACVTGLDAGRCPGFFVNEIPGGPLGPRWPVWTRLGPHVPVRQPGRRAPARGERAVSCRVRAPGRHAGAVPAAVGAQREHMLVVMITHRDLAVPRLKLQEQVLSRLVPETGHFAGFAAGMLARHRDAGHSLIADPDVGPGDERFGRGQRHVRRVGVVAVGQDADAGLPPRQVDHRRPVACPGSRMPPRGLAANLDRC